MKRIIIGLLVGLALIWSGCQANTYSKLRSKEKKLIKNYISRNNLVILEDEPAADHVWAENEYYHGQITYYGDYYFHLIKRGDSVRIDSISPSQIDTVDQQIVSGDVIVARYKQFGLTENPDTTSYWTTLDSAYPFEFHYGNTSECSAVGWHLAIKLMKYSDSQCEIICPSKLGFSDDEDAVTPYVYILKMKIKP